jgi:hypothetical protein
MVVQNADQAVRNANGYTRCDPGYCLKYTRTWLEIPSGASDAIEAWNNATHKHAESKNAKDAQHPPRGAPVFWKGGTSGHGHIALAVDNDNGRSTDTPSSGVVDTRPGDWWRNNWGMDYLGWTEDLNGIWIPYLKGGGSSTSPWASGDVYVEKLHHKQQDSDSVARLCYRLIHHPQMNDAHRPPKTYHHYNTEVVQAVKFWQKNINGSGDADPAPGPTDGSSMSNAQANRLFGDNYTVHTT